MINRFGNIFNSIITEDTENEKPDLYCSKCGAKLLLRNGELYCPKCEAQAKLDEIKKKTLDNSLQENNSDEVKSSDAEITNESYVEDSVNDIRKTYGDNVYYALDDFLIAYPDLDIEQVIYENKYWNLFKDWYWLNFGLPVVEHDTIINEAYYDRPIELPKARNARLMHETIKSLNNEDAYYSWIITGVPDEPTLDDFNFYALPENIEYYNDLVDLFNRLYMRYREDGFYKPNKEVLEFILKTDNTLGFTDSPHIILEAVINLRESLGNIDSFCIEHPNYNFYNLKTMYESVNLTLRDKLLLGRLLIKKATPKKLNAYLYQKYTK